MPKKYKIILTITLVVAIILIAVALEQFFVLRKAHSTFYNYYTFRGCVQLINKTDMSGTCKTSSGETINIV